MSNLTPSDVRNVAFNKPPLGRRGYDEDEVDGFLDHVERTLTALYREIDQLRAESARAAAPTSSPPPSPPSVPTGGFPLYNPAQPVPPTEPSAPAVPANAAPTGPPAAPGLDVVLAELERVKLRLSRVERALSGHPGF